jgi:hypothetical protein
MLPVPSSLVYEDCSAPVTRAGVGRLDADLPLAKAPHASKEGVRAQLDARVAYFSFSERVNP